MTMPAPSCAWGSGIALSLSLIHIYSLDTAELIMNLEDEFNITIEMNEKLSTVGELVALIEENVK